MTQYTVKHSDSFTGEVIFNGIPYGAVDRTGHWAIWKLSTMFQAARSACMREGNFLNFKDASRGGFPMFIVQQSIKLKPDIHKLNHYIRPLPIISGAYLKTVGNSSLTFVQTISNGNNGQYLGENAVTMVSVDIQTRRPRTFPGWFKEKYKNYQTYGKTAKDRIPLTPDGAFTRHIVTRYSDMDGNKHVNQASYIEYCLNCATEAAYSGHYRYYTTDMCLFPVLELDTYYFGESVAGDELKLMTWQNDKNDDQIYFSLCKLGKQIFFAQFVFDKTMSADLYSVPQKL